MLLPLALALPAWLPSQAPARPVRTAPPPSAQRQVPESTPPELAGAVARLLSADPREVTAGLAELRAAPRGGAAAAPALIEVVAAALAAPDWRRVPEALEAPARGAEQALAQLGEHAHEPLLAALSSPELSARRAAAFVLRGAPPEDARSPLVAALVADDLLLRAYVLQGLARVAAPEAIPALVPLALGDGPSPVRAGAVHALAATGDERAVPPLARVLADPSAELRRVAGAAIGEHRMAAAFGPLLSAFHAETDPPARCAMAAALGELGDAAALKPLLAALDDPDAATRGEVARALGRIGDRRATPWLLRRLHDAEARPALARALGDLRDRRAVRALIGLLDDDDDWTRRAAAQALVQICPGGPRSGRFDEWREFWRERGGPR